MDPKLFQIARSGKANALDEIKEDDSLRTKTPKDNRALHIASRFGHVDLAAKIVARCPDLLLEQTSTDDTPLHIAARAGHVDVVRRLIELAEERGVEGKMLEKANKGHNTVLHEAAGNRSDKVVELLIREKPDLVFKPNKAGASPLYVAAERGCVESVELILKVMKGTEEAKWKGPHGRTPLHAAITRRHTEIAKKLIDHAKKEVIRQKDRFGNSPLHHAVALGSEEIVSMLLESDISSAYIGDKDSRSPLLVAAGNDLVDIFEMILKCCPDCGEAVDNKGWNALHVAAEKGNLQVVKYIIGKKDFGLEELINEPNDVGDTPLHLAVSCHQLSVVSLLIKDERVDVNLINNMGKTAFDIARADNDLNKRFRKILACKALSQANGRGGVHRRDKSHREPRIDSYKSMAGAISTVAGLIITVSFAAGFTIPGGFISEELHQGKAVFASKPLFWLFILTDTVAFCTSIFVEFLLFVAVIGDNDLLVGVVSISIKLMTMSLLSLTLTFLFGLSLVLSKILSVIAHLVFIVVFCLVVRWIWGLSWFTLLVLSLKVNFLNHLPFSTGDQSNQYSNFAQLKSRSINSRRSSAPAENQPTLPLQIPTHVENQPTLPPQIPTHVENQPTLLVRVESQPPHPLESFWRKAKRSSMKWMDVFYDDVHNRR